MIIFNLNEVAREHYHKPDNSKHNHTKYLEECFGHLTNHFEENFNDVYLFSALTYERQDADGKKIETVPSGMSETDYHFNSKRENWKDFETEISELLKDVIETEECMSLTSTLLSDNINGKDLFLKSDGGYEDWQKQRPKTEIYSLSKIKCAEKFGDFLNIEGNRHQIKEFRSKNDSFRDYDDAKIGNLLWHYKRLNCLCKKGEGFFVHFIRPSFIDIGYNILLSFATTKDVDYESLRMIDLLIYRIASQMAIEKIKQSEKAVHSNYIFGIGHFLKHRISPILTNLVKANTELTSQYQVQDELQNIISLTRTALFSASVLDLYGKALQKRTTDKNYCEFCGKIVNRLNLVGNNGEINQDALKHYRLDENSLNIKGLVIEIVELMKKEKVIIQPIFEDGIDWDSLEIKPYIEYKKTDVATFLKPAKEIYHQFLHELFKNIGKSENALGRNPNINYVAKEKSIFISRFIDESDARNLEAAGVKYDEYSLIQGEEISGLSLMQFYLDVLGLGEISHKLIKGRWTKLMTRLSLEGLTEKKNEQN